MVQSHRCPATVSGTKSAETTEVLGLGKVQRVGKRREPGDLPYMALRRPIEGKGRQLMWADPDHARSGFFMCAAFLPIWDCTPSSRVEEAWERGSKPWFLPQPCPPLSCSPWPTRPATPCAASRVCARVGCRAYATYVAS